MAKEQLDHPSDSTLEATLYIVRMDWVVVAVGRTSMQRHVQVVRDRMLAYNSDWQMKNISLRQRELM